MKRGGGFLLIKKEEETKAFKRTSKKKHTHKRIHLSNVNVFNFKIYYYFYESRRRSQTTNWECHWKFIQGQITHLGRLTYSVFLQGMNIPHLLTYIIFFLFFPPASCLILFKAKSFASVGILYKPQFLSPSTLTSINKTYKTTYKHLLKPDKNSVAYGRTGCEIPLKSTLCSLLHSPNLTSKLRQLTDIPNLRPSLTVPPEIRRYAPKEIQTGMEWHVDDVLFEPPQIEGLSCFFIRN